MPEVVHNKKTALLFANCTVSFTLYSFEASQEPTPLSCFFLIHVIEPSITSLAVVFQSGSFVAEYPAFFATAINPAAIFGLLTI